MPANVFCREAVPFAVMPTPDRETTPGDFPPIA